MVDLKEFLDKFHIEDLQNPRHPSVFASHPEYDLFILRIPLVKEDDLVVESFGFVVTEEGSFYYDKSSDAFHPFKDKFLGLHSKLDKEVDKLLANIAYCDEVVGEMEDALYDSTTGRDYIERWFGMKKHVTRMERILHKSLGVLKQKVNYYKSDPEFPETGFSDLLEHVDRAHRYSIMLVAKLDNIYSFYNTRTNEKINSAVFTLTIISAIFLPLNLIVGFFGMNTGGLPFAEGNYGTFSAVLLMVFMIAVTLAVVHFWKNRNENS